MVRGDAVLHKLFTEIAERYAEREGGYTRVLRSRRRNNDAAQMAFIECALRCSGGAAEPLQSVRSAWCLQPFLLLLQTICAVSTSESCCASAALPGSLPGANKVCWR